MNTDTLCVTCGDYYKTKSDNKGCEIVDATRKCPRIKQYMKKDTTCVNCGDY